MFFISSKGRYGREGNEGKQGGFYRGRFIRREIMYDTGTRKSGVGFGKT